MKRDEQAREDNKTIAPGQVVLAPQFDPMDARRECRNAPWHARREGRHGGGQERQSDGEGLDHAERLADI